MGKYIINGCSKIEGEIKVNGSKNAALPILAATIIAEGENVIKNCPIISDVVCMVDILRDFGCKVEIKGNDIIVNSKDMNYTVLKDEKSAKMRSSITLLGALVSRFKQAETDCPGGCVIGARPVNYHIDAFKKMGVEFLSETERIKCKAKDIKSAVINLEYRSVGATENIMILAAKADGTSIINNAAKEPEIIDLQNYLNKCGAKIKGAGTDTIVIEGVKTLYPCEYSVMPDRIEAGTFLTAAMVAKGDLLLKNVDIFSLNNVLKKFSYAGAKITGSGNKLRLIKKGKIKAIPLVFTAPYPYFPTDMQPIITSMLTISNGTSIIIETVFESRYRHLDELKKMGAKLEKSGRVAVIQGVEKLYGADVLAHDLRGGAALIIAGIAAEGKTVIHNSCYIERGYESIDTRLKNIGVNIYFEN